MKEEDILKDHPLKDYPDLNTHHPKKTFGYLTFCGMITGCGLGQVYGVCMFTNSSDFKAALAPVLVYCKDVGCGTILCTLGSSLYNRESILLENDFTLLTEYRNLKHIKIGYPKDTQRLYFYNITDETSKQI